MKLGGKGRELLLVVVTVALAVWLFPRGRPAPPQEQATPSAQQATPSATQPTPFSIGSPMQSPEHVEMVRDLEVAEGMEGYEEVLALTYPLPSAGAQAKGRGLYKANCAVCHGDELRGGGPAGAALDPPPTDLMDARSYKYGSRELALYRTIFYGVDGTGMPPWGDVLTQKEIWDLVHYVRSGQRT